MTPAIQLDRTETVKIEDKSSMAYKALIVMIRELHSRTGLKVSVIGTDKKGVLFEIDIQE